MNPTGHSPQMNSFQRAIVQSPLQIHQPSNDYVNKHHYVSRIFGKVPEDVEPGHFPDSLPKRDEVRPSGFQSHRILVLFRFCPEI